MRRIYLRIYPCEAEGIVLVSKDNRYRLPYIDLIAGKKLPVRNLTTVVLHAAREKYKLEGVVLGFFKDNDGYELCDIEMYVEQQPDFCMDMALCEPTCLDGKECSLVATGPDRGTVFDILASSPWERRGWISVIRPWIEKRLEQIGERMVQPPLQIKGAWPRSTVLRVEAERQTYYFKWSYAIPPWEWQILSLLSEVAPSCVPEMTAYDETRNSLLLEPFEPVLIRDMDIGVEEEAVSLYAQIQLGTLSYLERLRNWGCPVLDSDSLILAFAKLSGDIALFSYGLRESDRDRLNRISPMLYRDCLQLLRGIVPVCLNNEDFQNGNLALKHGKVVIYDWANTYISHPFFSYHHFLFRRCSYLSEKAEGATAGTVCNEERILSQRYLQHWLKFASQEELERDFAISEKLFWLLEGIKCERERRYIEPGSEWYHNIMHHIVESLHKLISIYVDE